MIPDLDFYTYSTRMDNPFFYPHYFSFTWHVYRMLTGSERGMLA